LEKGFERVSIGLTGGVGSVGVTDYLEIESMETIY
jgi:hypothetical protein